MLNAVHDIGQYRPQVDGHVPEMIWLHRVEETSTAKLRRGLDPVRCSRILNIHVSWKFQPITKLSGKEFKHAWWVVIIYHRILWTSGVRQYDVNPNNLRVYRTLSGLAMGIINDYDLSSSENRTGAHERTGIMPFVAMDLLTKKATKGKVEHLYQHIAESFIWVLIWVCLQNEDGKLLSKDRPSDCWLTAFRDPFYCHKIKCRFLRLATQNRIGAHPSPQPTWPWAIEPPVLNVIALRYVKDPKWVLEGACIFRMWFEAQLPSSIRSLL
ncbi:hypothetical protein BDR07DRAFT_1487016 [Suillus spraguei]|nr:hypothetical protein BDR07DRAFT_1487016 [Suillus spraguei]